MLQDIIDSRVDSSVLSFFLAAPVRSYSALEVSKRLNFSSSQTSQALNKLSESGQLRTFSKKNKKYFLLNEKYKLLPAISAALLKNMPRYQDELFLAIRNLGKIKAAFLSGIFTGYANLPVDILVVGKVNLKKLDEFLKRLELMMGQEINYSIMTEDEFLLRRNTFDRFIKDIFDYKHLVVVDSLSSK